MKKAIFSLLLFLFFYSASYAQTNDELLEKGIELYKDKQYQQAIETLSSLIDKDKNNIGAFRIRGSSHMMLEKYDLAVKDFETAVRLGPESYGVHSDLGAAWYHKKEYDRALEYYNLEVEKAQDNHLLYFNRALCFEQLGNNDRALEDLDTSLEMKPDFYWALCYKANLLIQKNETQKAVALYENAIQLDPEKDYARQKLAQLSQNGFEKKKAGATSQPVSTTKIKKNTFEYTIQSGAFKNQENADRLKAKLIKNGFDSRVLNLTDSKDTAWYLVRSGSYPDEKTAGKAAKILKDKLGISSLVRPAGTW